MESVSSVRHLGEFKEKRNLWLTSGKRMRCALGWRGSMIVLRAPDLDPDGLDQIQ
jgi:hypothetical protein